MFQTSYRLCFSSTNDLLTVKYCLKSILIKSLRNILCATTYQVCCLLNKDTVSKSDLLYDFSWNICTQLMLLIYELLQTFAWEHIFCTNVDSSCSQGNHLWLQQGLKQESFLNSTQIISDILLLKATQTDLEIHVCLVILQPC